MRAVFALTLVLAGCLPNGPPTGAPDGGVAPMPTAATTTKKKPQTAPKGSASAGAAASDPPLAEPFVDEFDRGSIGNDWRVLGTSWRIEDGKLCAQHAKNRGIWLARRLPTNARIEFDVVSSSPDGDIKAEAWGDGTSGATHASYDDATSYLVVLGGWKNSLHVLARLDEHGRDRKEVKVDPNEDDPRARPVSPGQVYHLKIERTDGRTVSFSVDDVVIQRMDDAAPLEGPGHDHFGFNDWDAHVCFDNVRVTPL